MPHYAFVVGANQEWPEQRSGRGDVGLARCLAGRRCGLSPGDALVEVYDDCATRSRVLRSLEGLLDRRNDRRRTERRRRNGGGGTGGTNDDDDDGGDTLLFCYGGHGKRTAFCTQRESVRDGKIATEPWLRHAEVIDLLERKFDGGTAICLIDCCHAGGFGEEVARRFRDDAATKKRASPSSGVRYACVMSVPPADVAGMEWSMTECFLRAFGGDDLLPSTGGDDDGDDDGRCYYLSVKDGFLYTKDGTRPVDESKLLKPDVVADAAEEDATASAKNRRRPTWGQVIDYLADEYGRIKGNRLATLFRGAGMDGGTFLATPCAFGDDGGVASSPPAEGRIPRDLSWMDPFLGWDHAPNDWVYVKRCEYDGGGDAAGAGGDGTTRPTTAPRVGWFPGRILSVDPGGDGDDDGAASSSTTSRRSTMARIELHDVVAGERWTVAVPLDPSPSSSRNAVLGGLPFAHGFGFDPHACTDVVVRLAKRLAYVDATVPPNLEVEALWPEDGRYYEAKTICPTEVPWGDIGPTSGATGPCVPVRWKEDGTCSFVPTAACVVRDVERPRSSDDSRRETKATLAEKSAAATAVGTVFTPREAMMASFACGGKTFRGDAPLPDGPDDDDADDDDDDDDAWEAYDAEDSKWSRVRVMNGVGPSRLPLKVLAFHACYRESGGYTLVYWESDSSISLVPDGYLRRRRRTGKDGDDESSDDESSDEESSDGSDEDDSDEESSDGTEEDIASDEEEVRKYVDEANSKNDWDEEVAGKPTNPTDRRLFELGLFAIACLGLGFILGSTAKR